MPSTKTTIKKPRRKAVAKRPTKRAVKGAAKKRAPRKAASRVKKSVLMDEPQTPIETLLPFASSDVATQLPKEPEPEPIAKAPVLVELEPEEPVAEVAPIVGEPHFSTLSSRISFYLGVVTGAAVLHVLVFVLVAIMNS